MPSFRKKVSSYFRQLSFHNEPKDKRFGFKETSLVNLYLERNISRKEGPRIFHGKSPSDLPIYVLGNYETGYNSIVGCYSGPGGGLTTIKRNERHLSVSETDIDFIDTSEEPVLEITTDYKKPDNQPIDNSTMIIKVGGQEYHVSDRIKQHNRSHSLGSISDLNFPNTGVQKLNCNTSFDVGLVNQMPTTASGKSVPDFSTTNKKESKDENSYQSNISSGIKIEIPDKHASLKDKVSEESGSRQAIMVKKTKHTSESGDVLYERCRDNADKTKRATCLIQKNMHNTVNTCKGKNIQNLPLSSSIKDKSSMSKEKLKKVDLQSKKSVPRNSEIDDTLPDEWNKKSELIFGLSDSLYDTNQITKIKSGNPIADCFGIIARTDSAVLAVADGVNWGEKACIAAKSAVHGSLYYLNKTMFGDTKLFEALSVKSEKCEVEVMHHESPLKTTKDVFVCLLRAFTCAHDLILENSGLLTTLTVAIILPLKDKINEQNMGSHADNEISSSEYQYICCVCNVGDTLAYVYSQETGLRELTKGSHDINSNRDMRDALGALGPVDGINPELSNLTLSLTLLKKGDIVMVASDGLTDNFDPNVCKFSTSHPFQSGIETHKSDVSSATSKHSDPSGKNHADIRKFHQNSKSHHKKPSVKNTSLCSTQEKKSIKGMSKKQEEVSAVCRYETAHEGSKVDTPENLTEGNTIVQNLFLDSILKIPEDQINATENNNSSVEKGCHQYVQNTKTLGNQSNKIPCKALSHETRVSECSTKSNQNTGYKFLRSKTSLDFSYTRKKTILRDSNGIAVVTPIQRYELQLLLIEEVIKNGISGKAFHCITAKQICENLVDFTFNATSTKRRTLESPELYFDNRNGLLVEVSSHEKRARRRKALEHIQDLPGKLDHVTLIAYNVGNIAL